MKRLWGDEQGQALVEYILILSAVVLVIGIFARGMRQTIVGVWKRWNLEIAAPCPGCKAPGFEGN